MATTAKKPAPSDIQIVAKDFRQGSAVTGLAKKLFDPSEQLNLSPALITQILGAAGVQTPPGVRITADAAQILLAGGAIASNVEMGADLGAYSSPTALVVKGVTDILSVTGLMDSKSPAAQLLMLGVDIALVLSSGGLNIFADLALVLDLIGAFFTALPDNTAQYTAYAHYLNQQAFYDWSKNRMALEKTAAATHFQDYQNKQMDCFEFIGEIATDAPDLFLNFFPEMGFFFPPMTAQACFSSEVIKHDTGGILGMQSRDYDIVKNDCFSYLTIQNRRSDIQNGIFKKFVEAPARIFFDIQTLNKQMQNGLLATNYAFPPNSMGVTSHLHPVPRIDIKDYAVLSMFPPYFQFLKPGMDIRPFLAALSLTPADLGYSVVEDQMTTGDFISITPPPQPGITFNGVDYIDPLSRQKDLVRQANLKEAQSVVSLDRAGNIQGLLKDKLASRIIAEWGMPVIPTENQNDPSRNIQNLWSAVSIVNQLKKDKIFQTLGGGGLLDKPMGQSVNPVLAGFDFENQSDNRIGTPEYYDQRYRELQFKSAGRKMNQMARQKIASYYGTTADKLKWRKPTQPGQLAAVIPA